MPTINVSLEVPQDVYDLLEKWAAKRKRTLAEEVTEVLKQVAAERKETPVRLPDYIEPQEIDPPVELPRPPSLGKVPYKTGAKRLPDPPIFREEAS